MRVCSFCKDQFPDLEPMLSDGKPVNWFCQQACFYEIGFNFQERQDKRKQLPFEYGKVIEGKK